MNVWSIKFNNYKVKILNVLRDNVSQKKYSCWG